MRMQGGREAPHLKQAGGADQHIDELHRLSLTLSHSLSHSLSLSVTHPHRKQAGGADQHIDELDRDSLTLSHSLSLSLSHTLTANRQAVQINILMSSTDSFVLALYSTVFQASVNIYYTHLHVMYSPPLSLINVLMSSTDPLVFALYSTVCIQYT